MRQKLVLGLVLVFIGQLVIPLRAYGLDGYFDEYGKIRWSDERIHLLGFEKILLENPDLIGYIGFHWRTKTEFAEMKRRAIRARNCLVRRKKLARARIIIIEGREREYPLTILQPVKKGSPPPKFG
jgi:hypothetical protein